VSADEATQAATRYLDTAKLSTVIVGDHSAIADSLGTLGLGTPSVLPLEV
jgi:hypothetical protein